MSIGLKNKLKDLIGEKVRVIFGDGHATMEFPGDYEIIASIENDDCVVIEYPKHKRLTYLPISKISALHVTTN